MNDCELPTDRLWSPNIQGFFNSKMTNLLVIKDPKSDCSIVNKFFRCFKANCYTIVLSNGNTCGRDCLVYYSFLYQ
jgi:hypothetical protein